MVLGSVRVIGILDNNQLAYWSFVASRETADAGADLFAAVDPNVDKIPGLQATSNKQQATSNKRLTLQVKGL